MTRSELKIEITDRFEKFVDGVISSERLHTEIRMLVDEFCEGISDDLRVMSEMLDKVREI